MTPVLAPPVASRVAPCHLPGVDGAATLETPGLREIRVAIAPLCAIGGIVLIDGKPGVGKTFGARNVIAGLGVRAHWVDMPDTPKGKEANARIYAAVTGRRPPHRMTEYALTEETVDVLDGLTAVLAIDEAQNMTRSALRQVRYLHDRPTTRVLLVLIGSGVTGAVAQVPELDSRVSRRVRVEELGRRDVTGLVRQLHPTFAATGTDVLVELGTYAKGNLRRWARIVEVAASFGIDADDGIGPDLARHVIRAITGGAR